MVLEAKQKRIKERLKAGETVYGPFVRMATPQSIEILGYAGFDFCIIDTEHGSLTFETVENLVRATEVTNMSAIVRTSIVSPHLILRALDTGAQGVQVPGIGNAGEAGTVVRSARYHPDGERGVCRFVRAAKYSHIPVTEYFKGANDEVLVVVQVEGEAGVNNLDAILEVPGLDVVFLGPYDLSQFLGLTGQVEHPKVVALLHKLVERIRSRGLAVGIFTDKEERVPIWREAGVQYISVCIDTGILYEAARRIISNIRG